ncbi:MAG: chemotaxis response regulator protein-glutamate methylesterase [Gemmatimonadota bacterium]
MSDPVRVLLVDDSLFVRRAVERMLASEAGMEVVGTAGNGAEAVALAKELRPDVIVLDVNMPRLDGLQALRQIMAEAPSRVLMLSSMTREGADTTLKALDLGAVDFLDKSSAGTVMDIYALAPALREKILAVAGAAVPHTPPDAVPTTAEVVADGPTGSAYEAIVIGASTGGPRGLLEILSRLPANFPTGIVIAQHMPWGFTETLAERLDSRSILEVREASDRDRVQPGRALIAPGGRQISLQRRGDELAVRIEANQSELLHRPSVDFLFHSAAETVGDRAIGVILTGMGDDGATGLQAIRDAGGRTIAESEETAVIYGMPKVAAAAAERIVPVSQIPTTLVQICSERPASEGTG